MNCVANNLLQFIHQVTIELMVRKSLAQERFKTNLEFRYQIIESSIKFRKGLLKDSKTLRVGYNLDIMRQSACLVLNPITVYSYGFLFNCTTVGQASDSLTALT